MEEEATDWERVRQKCESDIRLLKASVDVACRPVPVPYLLGHYRKSQEWKTAGGDLLCGGLTTEFLLLCRRCRTKLE